jgi:toxin CcdB
MGQFDVHEHARGGRYSLLLDVQSELLSSLATRVVVPLAMAKGFGAKPISRLNPTLKHGGVEYLIVVQELAAVPKSALGRRVMSLAERRADIIAALDLLLTGL